MNWCHLCFFLRFLTFCGKGGGRERELLGETARGGNVCGRVFSVVWCASVVFVCKLAHISRHTLVNAIS